MSAVHFTASRLIPCASRSMYLSSPMRSPSTYIDNYDGPNFIEQARQLRSEYDGSTSSFLLEASGGITDATVASYMSDVTDIISLGWLSQSVPHVDWSLKIKY
eukprot:TRINITY_DN2961_c0_g1_i1.p2 TRINITY_DN2961_c0_g1~~TRINITY_DN2961_c0_g1_i1.p2  ORF type:complete len:103 (-),score=19.32 TRINITY_DN2961_c0_g1_i1:175-483(-)